MPQWMLIGVAGALGGLSVTLNTPLDQNPDNSIGAAGIDAYRLQAPPYNLTGRKIAIGQVEIGRPGKFGVDKAVSKNWAIAVTRVFFRDSPARVNTHVDPHAQNVASIMVSNHEKLRGIAPEARLYSSAVGLLLRSGQPEECMSAQHIASQNGGDVRTINFSFGESLRQDPRPQARLDGNALLTQCIDWSSRVHNVLYVVAGNQGRGGISIPTDNFNGVNVAFTSRLRNVFALVDPANLGDLPTGAGAQSGLESNVGPRRSISLVAPGSNITVVNPDGRTNKVTGTSFAAPHVTASIALLQEYGDTMLRQPKRSPAWSLDSRNHEVMKAVLMNAADKVKDKGDGWLLGMSRTILDRNQQDWFASDAYRDRMVPLNLHMGTGQLNTFRAYQQFSAGQWSPEAPVPTIGWDYRTVSANTSASQFRDYVIDQPLQKDSFVSVTLAWNRRVELQDQNQNGKYDIGESFSDRGLNNLDIYLMPAEAQDPAESVWASVSEVDSVEHIFHRVPATGRYKIRVRYHQQVNQATQPYALAWWTVPAR